MPVPLMIREAPVKEVVPSVACLKVPDPVVVRSPAMLMVAAETVTPEPATDR